MSKEVRQGMIEAVQAMHEYLMSLGVPELEKDVTFYVLQDLDDLVEALIRESGSSVERARIYWKRGPTARAGGKPRGQSWIILNSASEWFANTSRQSQMKVAAHELYHAYQNGLSGLSGSSPENRVPQDGPRWLTEGTAEIFAYRSMSDADVLSYDSEREGFVKQGQRVDKPLSEMEKQEGFRAVSGSYKYSLLAA